MLASIERWLPLSIRQNEDDLRMARILLVIMIAAVIAFLLAIILGVYRQHWSITIANVVGLAFLGIPLGLLARGKMRSSVVFLALDALGVITYVATIGRGIQDIAVTAYPVIVLFAAWAMNKRYFLLFVILTDLSIGWVGMVAFFGWFATRPIDFETVTDAVLAIMATTIAALIAYLMAYNMRQNLARARKEIAEHNRTEIQLQSRRTKPSIDCYY
jgi:hypothetical protein